MENLSQDIIKFVEKLVQKLRTEWEVLNIETTAPTEPLIEYKLDINYSLKIDEIIDLGYWEFVSGTGYVWNTVLTGPILQIDEINNIIQIDNTDLIDLQSVTTIRNKKPYFYHGTFIEVNKELDTSKEILSDALYPAVIVWEVIRQNFEADKTLNIGNTPRLTMSFLDTTNKLDWTNDEQYEYAINPMERYADKFIKICEKHPYLLKLEDYTYVKNTNWGKVVRDKGHVKYLLDENLAGLNLEIDLPIKKACLNKFAKI